MLEDRERRETKIGDSRAWRVGGVSGESLHHCWIKKGSLYRPRPFCFQLPHKRTGMKYFKNVESAMPSLPPGRYGSGEIAQLPLCREHRIAHQLTIQGAGRQRPQVIFTPRRQRENWDSNHGDDLSKLNNNQMVS